MEAFVDDGNQHLVSSGVSGHGSVDYATGAAQISFNGAIPDGLVLVAEYQYTR